MRRKRIVFMAVMIFVAASLMLAGIGNAQRKTETPAGELPKVNWTMQTTWAEGWLLHDMALDFARRLSEMSAGKFTIEVLPAGAVVGGFDVLDAADSGVIEAYHSWTGYWMGRHPSAPFFASIPMHFEPLMHVTWFYAYGGKELLQEMYDEMGMNVYAIPGGVTHPEVLAHSHKPLENLQDWVGLKYRAPGWWGEILTGLGVKVTMLPGTALYQALSKGIVDATEFSSPIVNRQQGFHRVTQYVAGPGMHQPTCFFEFGFNKDSYDALPEHYKKMIQSAAMATTLWSWTQDIVLGIDTFEYWESIGKTFTRVSDEAQREIRIKAWEWIDRDVAARNNDHYTRTWKSVQEFWKKFVNYERMMIPIRE